MFFSNIDFNFAHFSYFNFAHFEIEESFGRFHLQVSFSGIL